MTITEDMFESLMPAVVTWATEKRDNILRRGRRLTAEEQEIAQRLLVKRPEAVRLMKVHEIPLPDDPMLALAAESLGIVGPNIIGLSLEYAIFLRDDAWESRLTIIHELVHTHQAERLGGLEPFLRQYLAECVEYGYDDSPLEREAREIEARYRHSV